MPRAIVDISAHAFSLADRPQAGQMGHLHLVSSSRRPGRKTGLRHRSLLIRAEPSDRRTALMRYYKPATMAAICIAAFAAIVVAAINHPGDNAFDTSRVGDASLAIERPTGSLAEKSERKKMADLEEFIRGLLSPDKEDSIYSINAIAYLGPSAASAIPELVSLLDDSDEDIARLCGRASAPGPTQTFRDNRHLLTVVES